MKYEDIQKADLIEPLMEDFRRGIAEVKGDKIVFDFKQTSPDTPWYFHTIEKERNCTLWHKIVFDRYGILPRQCMHCWKIVARPKNLDELFELNKLQEEMLLPSKTGVDIRASETYKGIYLGFWYCPLGDFAQARELYKEVKRKVRGALSLDTPVILKRGCTEMENAFGPSHEWVYTPEMRFMEDLINSTVEVEDRKPPQPSVVKNRVVAFWILYAHRMGDKCAAKYIRNFPYSMGSIPTSTYHDVVPKIKEEFVPAVVEEGEGS